jgi:hypothetical protein
MEATKTFAIDGGVKACFGVSALATVLINGARIAAAMILRTNIKCFPHAHAGLLFQRQCPRE